MEINIRPEDIDVYVKEAILKSTFGKQIEASLQKCLKEILESYRSPVEELVKRELGMIVREFVNRPEIKEKILGVISSIVSRDKLDRVVEGTIEEVIKRMSSTVY